MGSSNHPDICWKDRTAGLKQSRRSEYTDDKFLAQVIEEPTGKAQGKLLCWMWYLWTAEKQTLAWPRDGGVQHPKKESRAKIRTIAFHFWRADFKLFRDLLWTIPWDVAKKRKAVQESWLIFKDHLLQTQETSISTRRKSAQTAGSLHGWASSSWLNSDLKKQLNVQEMEEGTVDPGGIQSCCPSTHGWPRLTWSLIW